MDSIDKICFCYISLDIYKETHQGQVSKLGHHKFRLRCITYSVKPLSEPMMAYC